MGVEGIFKQSAENGYKAILEEIRVLSPYMRVARIPHLHVPFKQQKELRRDFDDSVKIDFIRWIGWQKEKELKDTFCLDDSQINTICRNGRISGPQLPVKLNMCSIDHIVPLSVGGQNNFSNLCIIPDWINLIKANFQKSYHSSHPSDQNVHVLVPVRDKDGRFPFIPHFPDEFYVPRSERMLERMARMEDRAPANP